MNLIDIVNNSMTDKNTGHSYLELYHNLLKNKIRDVFVLVPLKTIITTIKVELNCIID